MTKVDGMVVRGERLTIPGELQPMVVQLAREGHLGQEKTLGLLRETCWFLSMGDMVRQYGESCIPCLATHACRLQGPDRSEVLPAHFDRPVHQVSGGGGVYQHRLGANGAHDRGGGPWQPLGTSRS